MGISKNIFNSSIGRKLLMALSGLGFIGFLLGHVSGNLLLFKGDNGKSFNEYAHFMKTTPVIWVTEVIIFTLIIVHIVDAIILTVQNKKARPQPYAGTKNTSKASFASRKASALGIILLAFFILHMADFFIPAKLLGLTPKTPDGLDDLYAVVVAKFSNIVYVIIYVACMIPLFFHLSHGFQSAFQTMGWRHPKYTPMIKGFGYFLGVVIPGLFASMPLFIYLFK